MAHPFRFGITASRTTDGTSWCDLARQVEDRGFSTLCVPDHFRDQFDPFVAMMSAAARTRTLRVSSLVLSNDFRHPAVLARAAATLDLLSDGRLELGIGAGWAKVEYQRIGLDFRAPRLRIECLEECLDILRLLFEGVEVTYEGQHYQLRSHTCAPMPRQAGGPPILIGGGGPRMLRLAAVKADIVGIGLDLRSGQNLNPATPEFGGAALPGASVEAMEGSIGIVREAAGERFDSLELNLLVSHCDVTSSRKEVIATLAARLGTEPEAVEKCPHLLVGSVEQLCERLIELRESLGISYFIFRRDVMEEIAPVVDKLRSGES